MLPAGGWADKKLRGELLEPRNSAWLPLRARAIKTTVPTIMRADMDEDGENIIIREEETKEISGIVAADNPRVIDLAFDQLDRRFLTWQIGSDVYINWFDPLISGFTTTLITEGENPCCALDDRRDALIQNSDIMLVYQRGDLVFYRMQRDRFLIEYPVPHSYQSPLVRGCGMGTNLRFCIRILGFID